MASLYETTVKNPKELDFSCMLKLYHHLTGHRLQSPANCPLQSITQTK